MYLESDWGRRNSTSYCTVLGRGLSEEIRNINLSINILEKSLDRFMGNIKLGYQEREGIFGRCRTLRLT